MEPEDHLQIIAESYKSIADAEQAIAASTRVMQDVTQSLDANLHILRLTHRLALRLQGFALALLGVSLLGIGGLLWHLGSHRGESAAVAQALLTNTQTIAAQTRALLERQQER